MLGAVLALTGGWSRDVALDQAIGLALHAAVVLVRGVLPTVLATGAACLLWRHARGSDPGVPASVALSLVLAALVTGLVLTPPLAGWPRLQIERPADALATVVLLGAAGAAADLLARRLLRGRAAPAA